MEKLEHLQESHCELEARLQRAETRETELATELAEKDNELSMAQAALAEQMAATRQAEADASAMEEHFW